MKKFPLIDDIIKQKNEAMLTASRKRIDICFDIVYDAISDVLMAQVERFRVGTELEVIYPREFHAAIKNLSPKEIETLFQELRVSLLEARIEFNSRHFGKDYQDGQVHFGIKRAS